MSQIARNGADIAIPLAIQQDPPTCAAIKLQDEFELGTGEWFADVNQGVAYIVAANGVGPILGVKNPNINNIRALYRTIILNTPGIVSVRELQVTYDPKARFLGYRFAAVDNTGAIIIGGNNGFYVGNQPT